MTKQDDEYDRMILDEINSQTSPSPTSPQPPPLVSDKPVIASSIIKSEMAADDLGGIGDILTAIHRDSIREAKEVRVLLEHSNKRLDQMQWRIAIIAIPFIFSLIIYLISPLFN